MFFRFFFFSSRRRHTRLTCDWSSDVCSSDLRISGVPVIAGDRELDPWRGRGEGGVRGHVLAPRPDALTAAWHIMDPLRTLASGNYPQNLAYQAARRHDEGLNGSNDGGTPVAAADGPIPGLTRVDHFGFTVPDLEQARAFLVDVLGCEYMYTLGPY